MITFFILTTVVCFGFAVAGWVADLPLRKEGDRD